MGKHIFLFILCYLFFLTSFIHPSVYADTCDQSPIVQAPDLFQINTTTSTATLYFSPINQPISEYVIAYGYSQGDQRFGVTVPFGQSTGVISYTIGNLLSNTTYYFQVRAGNGCATGAWSNTLAANTKNNGAYYNSSVSAKVNMLPKSGNEVFLLPMIALALLSIGIVLRWKRI